ncbi:hypothetical protein ACFX15_024137 [Malus domestica]
MCLTLVFAVQKLRHYMHAYTIHLVAKADPIKYVVSKPILTGRLAKWALLLNQYEIIYVPAKLVNGQALADFFADHPIPANWKISDDLPNDEVFYINIFPTWTMFFDGSARTNGTGAEVVFMSPQRQVQPYSFRLKLQKCPFTLLHSYDIHSWPKTAPNCPFLPTLSFEPKNTRK